MKPFMKWVGGKRQLLKEITSRMPKQYNCYYEPFLGCGTLILDLQPEKAVAGDINKQLINLWLQIRDNPLLIVQELSWLNHYPCDKSRYIQVRHEYNNLKHVLSPATAATTLWLNAFCFNGLYRLNSKGDFNVPWNKKTTPPEYDIENLLNISNYLKRVDISCRSYQDTCATVEEGDFVYFDPPYDPVSSTANFTAYAGSFGEQEQKELAALFKQLSDRNVFVMLSNNDTPFIRQLYDGFTIETIKVKRNINSDSSKRTGSEVIITNY